MAGRVRAHRRLAVQTGAVMTGVRVLAGTRKGAFILTSGGGRDRWEVSGPHFAGWEVYHVKGSPADPDRLYASQSSGWSGQVIQRSDDGGATWAPAGSQFAYDGTPGMHQWYDGTPHPWEFERVWHLEPSLDDADTVWAGVEDAGLFRSGEGGQSWQELPKLRGHESGPSWQPGAGGMCLHTILLDPSAPGADVRRDLSGGRVPLRRRRAHPVCRLRLVVGRSGRRSGRRLVRRMQGPRSLAPRAGLRRLTPAMCRAAEPPRRSGHGASGAGLPSPDPPRGRLGAADALAATRAAETSGCAA